MGIRQSPADKDITHYHYHHLQFDVFIQDHHVNVHMRLLTGSR
jgi:hypothetical protein